MKILNEPLYNTFSQNIKDILQIIEKEYNKNESILCCGADDNLMFDLDEILYNSLDSKYFSNGVSKVCIIDESNTNYVIKLPLIYKECGDYDEESDEFYSDLYRQINYIEKDLKVYNESLFQDFLAPVIPIAQFDNDTENGDKFYIYAQTRCYKLYDSLNTKTIRTKQSDDKIIEIQKQNELYLPFNEQWLSACLNYYPEQRIRDLIEVQTHYLKGFFNDMHSGNYGYEYTTGRPLIFDYSGY